MSPEPYITPRRDRPQFVNENKTWTDTAAYCKNGHLVNAQCKNNPRANRKTCPECKAGVLYRCPSCDKEFPGITHVPGRPEPRGHPVPRTCPACGYDLMWP